MPTTQSEDPAERVDHPRHYNQHPSHIECIDLIEHLPFNLANAVKYLWRCGVKQSEMPLRDLQKARWYTAREAGRRDLCELAGEPPPKTEMIWRALAREVCAADADSILADYLACLLEYDFCSMKKILDNAILREGEVR